MRKHDITKLPRWAQDQIARLEYDIRYLEGKLQRQQDGNTDVFYELGFDGRRQPLPPGSTLICRTPKGTVSMNTRKGRIEVYASGQAVGSMHIKPLAANHFVVGFDDRT
jgi:hypothetical protein